MGAQPPHIMVIEITYEYKEDKHTPPCTSYTYYFSKSDDLKTSITEASKHFTKFKSSNGWSKKAKLKSIQKVKSE